MPHFVGKAENMSMQFLRLNKNGAKRFSTTIKIGPIQGHLVGTVPTLVVPLEKTLGPEDDHRFRSIAETKVRLPYIFQV